MNPNLKRRLKLCCIISRSRLDLYWTYLFRMVRGACCDDCGWIHLSFPGISLGYQFARSVNLSLFVVSAVNRKCSLSAPAVIWINSRWLKQHPWVFEKKLAVYLCISCDEVSQPYVRRIPLRFHPNSNIRIGILSAGKKDALLLRPFTVASFKLHGAINSIRPTQLVQYCCHVGVLRLSALSWPEHTRSTSLNNFNRGLRDFRDVLFFRFLRVRRVVRGI